MFALRIGQLGDLEGISFEDIDMPKVMGREDLAIEQQFFGFNYDDVMIAKKQYPLDYSVQFNRNNKIIGLEAAGVVRKIGSQVDGFENGDRVIYSLGNLGSYCNTKIMHQSFLTKIPDELEMDVAASCLRKGIWCHILLYRTIVIRRKSNIMIHNITDPLESMLCQWAKAIGLNVIGTVTDEESKNAAKDLGASLIINREKEDVVEVVREFTKDKGVSVVYDSVGKGVEQISIDCIHYFGSYIHYHSKNGKPEISIDQISERSIFLTSPVLEQYKSSRLELQMATTSTFVALKKGYIKPIFETAELSDAKDVFVKTYNGKYNKNVVFINSTT